MDKEEENIIEEEEVAERRRLMNKLEEVIFKDAVAWKQKMKLRWIKEWDNNSRLFHILVNNRRNKKMAQWDVITRDKVEWLERRFDIEEISSPFVYTHFGYFGHSHFPKWSK